MWGGGFVSVGVISFRCKWVRGIFGGLIRGWWV